MLKGNILVLVALSFLSTCINGAPEIQFTFGRVLGADKFAQSTQKPYYSYYGIPFAQPPLGNLRFRAPQPFVGSGPNVVISSNTFRDSCSQVEYELANFKSSEDCLYLNVFTPADLSNVKKVMFWIHGGGYTTGDATDYIPSRLVTDYDVIVVTTQYRLGPFGFLSAGKGNGNNGLRDQIMALKWVKDNIGQFGGDPDDITIFGESAGSGSVSFLSVSPLTKGLFTKAIMQSGTVLSSWAANPNNAEDVLFQSSKALGCSSIAWYFRWFNKEAIENRVMECIRSKSEQEILSLYYVNLNNFDDVDEDDKSSEDGKTTDSGKSDKDGMVDGSSETVETGKDGDYETYEEVDWEKLSAKGLSFEPVVDGEVIPRDPRSMLADRQYLQQVGALDRDYVMGFTNNEGLLVGLYALSIMPLEDYTQPKNAANVIKATVKPELSLPESLRPGVLDLLNYEYTYPRLENGRVPFQGLMDMNTDILFGVPTVQFARALTKASDRTNVYLYLFDHYPELIDPTSPLKGTAHALDIVYEFDFEDYIKDATGFYANIPSPSDGNLADIFRGTLTQFAKTGNPSRGTSEPVSWPRFDPRQEYYLAISPTPEVRQHVYAKRISLWTDFVFKTAEIYS